ncbi:Uncharacterized protein PHSC3_000786 [Chlamydiales bacterium STE3]|nr:Uncharacterized protein PHSC3_000786 [Chlamydiales bacterium STE3]
MAKILGFLLSIFTSFSLFADFNYSRESNKIVNAFIKEKKKTLKVYPFGIGGGERGEVNLISLYFDCYRLVDKTEAQKILVTLVEDLAQRFNENKKIRPYLHHFPFGAESIHILIGFKDASRKSLFESSDQLVSLQDGMVRYSEYNQMTDKYECKGFEPYEEVLKAYKENLETQKY